MPSESNNNREQLENLCAALDVIGARSADPEGAKEIIDITKKLLLHQDKMISFYSDEKERDNKKIEALEQMNNCSRDLIKSIINIVNLSFESHGIYDSQWISLTYQIQSMFDDTGQ